MLLDAMARLRTTLVAALALAAPSAGHAADLRVDGRGFGHGIGLSQWGAYGYALKAHRRYTWILAHYYPGARLVRARERTVRVLLRRARSQTVSGASVAVGGGRTVRLHDDRAYEVTAAADTLRLYDTVARRTKVRLPAPVRISGGATVRLHGRADNGVTGGDYRGDLLLYLSGRRIEAVNRVGLERYLSAVVPSEMPSGWPADALEAQAVAARTYALATLKPGSRYDAFADVRSQMYRGATAETAATTAAVRATRARILTYRGEVARTYFFSSSGGRTAAIEDEWNAAPIPYLRSVPDPYDYLSPVHTWTVVMPLDRAERALGDLVKGELEDVSVVERNASGRARRVEVVGSQGSVTATAAEIRKRLGLRSTWFSVSLVE